MPIFSGLFIESFTNQAGVRGGAGDRPRVAGGFPHGFVFITFFKSIIIVLIAREEGKGGSLLIKLCVLNLWGEIASDLDETWWQFFPQASRSFLYSSGTLESTRKAKTGRQTDRRTQTHGICESYTVARRTIIYEHKRLTDKTAAVR